MDGLDVRFSSAEPFPFVCAEYVCRCGAAVAAHGHAAGSAPAGWTLVQGEHEGDQDEYVCPRCAANATPVTPAG